MITRKKVTTAVKQAGRKAAHRIAVKTDEVLVDVGKAAEQRQRGRAVKSVLKTATRAAAIAAATATTIMAARAAARARRRRAAAAAH